HHLYSYIESCFYIKTLSLTFDLTLLPEPENNVPYFPTLKACVLSQCGGINAFPAPFDNG
ncbi:unnamed protein product, partial [marine sediment metagenome]